MDINMRAELQGAIDEVRAAAEQAAREIRQAARDARDECSRVICHAMMDARSTLNAAYNDVTEALAAFRADAKYTGQLIAPPPAPAPAVVAVVEADVPVVASVPVRPEVKAALNALCASEGRNGNGTLRSHRVPEADDGTLTRLEEADEGTTPARVWPESAESAHAEAERVHPDRMDELAKQSGCEGIPPAPRVTRTCHRCLRDVDIVNDKYARHASKTGAGSCRNSGKAVPK